jgi:hypothetical protein
MINTLTNGLEDTRILTYKREEKGNPREEKVPRSELEVLYAGQEFFYEGPAEGSTSRHAWDLRNGLRGLGSVKYK